MTFRKPELCVKKTRRIHLLEKGLIDKTENESYFLFLDIQIDWLVYSI